MDASRAVMAIRRSNCGGATFAAVGIRPSIAIPRPPKPSSSMVTITPRMKFFIRASFDSELERLTILERRRMPQDGGGFPGIAIAHLKLQARPVRMPSADTETVFIRGKTLDLAGFEPRAGQREFLFAWKLSDGYVFGLGLD